MCVLKNVVVCNVRLPVRYYCEYSFIQFFLYHHPVLFAIQYLY